MAIQTKNQHLKTEHLLTIVNWLDNPSNFARCFGVSKQTSVGKQSTKTAGFKAMAQALAKSTAGKFVLTPKQMRERFTTYKNRYLRAKDYEDSTGAGVTAQDEENGICTMAQKMESLCPCYDKMDKLFGKKANVAPLAYYDSTESALAVTPFRGVRSDGNYGDELVSDDGYDNETESAEGDTTNSSQMQLALASEEPESLTPRSPTPSLSPSDPFDDAFSSIPLTQPTPASIASASPVAQLTQRNVRTELMPTNPIPVPPKSTAALGETVTPVDQEHHYDIEASGRTHSNSTLTTPARDRHANFPSAMEIDRSGLSGTFSSAAIEVREQVPKETAAETTTRQKHASRSDRSERTTSESRPSKKPRKSIVSLNSSPRITTGSGSRIATAMTLAAESKAIVERRRLEFEKEKWLSDAERRSEEQQLERERLAFEKTKWEDECADRRSAMQQQQRFQMLSSLIEKGHTVDEAKEFLALL